MRYIAAWLTHGCIAHYSDNHLYGSIFMPLVKLRNNRTTFSQADAEQLANAFGWTITQQWQISGLIGLSSMESLTFATTLLKA